jgi:hypothetical protein
MHAGELNLLASAALATKGIREFNPHVAHEH